MSAAKANPAASPVALAGAAASPHRGARRVHRVAEGAGTARVQCGASINSAPADHVRPASRTRALAARLPARRPRGGVPRDRRAARHAPFPARSGRPRAAAASAVGGAPGPERGLHAAVALHPGELAPVARTHPCAGGERADRHRARARRARGRVHEAEGRGRARGRRTARGGARRGPRAPCLRPPHPARDGSRLGGVRDREHVARRARRGARPGLGVDFRADRTRRPAGDAGGGETGGGAVPRPRRGLLPEADARAGTMGQAHADVGGAGGQLPFGGQYIGPATQDVCSLAHRQCPQFDGGSFEHR